MILTTRQQAENFVLYALQNDPLLEDIEVTELKNNIMPLVSLVFGTQTFSVEDQHDLIDETIARWLLIDDE